MYPSIPLEWTKYGYWQIFFPMLWSIKDKPFHILFNENLKGVIINRVYACWSSINLVCQHFRKWHMVFALYNVLTNMVGC